MMEIDRGLLSEQALIQGITLTDEALDRFGRYASLLLEWNEKINLTAIKEPEEIIAKHFIDSLTVARVLPSQPIALIDVGTGAGFPGVPLAIFRKDIKLTLLDSLNKRLLFLETLCRELDVPVTLIHARAEDAGRKEVYREKYDVATARAVASLSILAEYCLPFVKINGSFVAMKGPDCDKEIELAGKAIYLLGAKLDHVENTAIQSKQELLEHRIILIKKNAHSPANYPRVSTKIAKQPL